MSERKKEIQEVLQAKSLPKVLFAHEKHGRIEVNGKEVTREFVEKIKQDKRFFVFHTVLIEPNN